MQQSEINIHCQDYKSYHLMKIYLFFKQPVDEQIKINYFLPQYIIKVYNRN